MRAFNRQFPNPPDVVAHPRNEQEVEAVLEWCSGAGYAAIPYGGGSSVVGGVEPPDNFDGVVTIDLSAMDRVLEVARREFPSTVLAREKLELPF